VLVDAAILAIVVGLIAGGRLGRLKDLDLRAPWVFVVAALLQGAVMALGARGWPLAARIGGPTHVLTFVILLLGLVMNRHLKGMWVVSAGVLLNLAAIAANGGSMPVDRELAVKSGSERMVELLDSSRYATHMPVTEGTRLRALGDVLPLPLLPVPPRPKPFCPGSVGDVLITAGACWLILTGLGAFGLGRRQQRDTRPPVEGED
jgi:hypothetical protein